MSSSSPCKINTHKKNFRLYCSAADIQRSAKRPKTHKPIFPIPSGSYPSRSKIPNIFNASELYTLETLIDTTLELSTTVSIIFTKLKHRGPFAFVYDAQLISSSETQMVPVVVKVSLKFLIGGRSKSKFPFSFLANDHLNHFNILSRLKDPLGFLPLVGYYENSPYVLLVTEQLGDPLLSTQADRIKDPETLYEIIHQILEILRKLHIEAQFAHLDISPMNILWGKSSSHRQLYLIDFGCAHDVKNLGPYIHSSFIGTKYFASIRAHLNLPLSFLSDLESFLYLIQYVLSGNLPWYTSETLAGTLELKKIYQPTNRSLIALHSYIHTSPFDIIPDYNQVLSFFRPEMFFPL